MPETKTMTVLATHSCGTGQQSQTLPWIRRDSGTGGRSLQVVAATAHEVDDDHMAIVWRRGGGCGGEEGGEGRRAGENSHGGGRGRLRWRRS